MTVATQISKSGPYAGAGTTGPFLVNFRFLDQTHLEVIKTSAAGLDTTLTLTTDYTVAGVGNPTGSVTLVAALAVGEKLTIIRNVPLTQEADYVQNDDFPAESHENALDKLTMITQQLGEGLDRSLTLPASVPPGTSTELPTPVADNFIGWNSTGTALRNVDPSTLATIVAYASWRTDAFTGTGVQTAFVLTADPGNANNCDVVVGGVPQQPGVDFTVSGTTLTFTAPPANGLTIFVRYGQALPQGAADAASTSFDWTQAYSANTAGWGIRSAANEHNVLRWIAPNLWAAILDGTSVVDVSASVQTAINQIEAWGGGALFVPGKLLCNTPLRLPDGVDLIGCGRNHARIVKDSTTTLAVTVVAGALTVYGGATLPANINAIIVLDGAGGRYTGRVMDITLEGTLAIPGNYETQKVEFGIVSIGSVSDYTRARVNIISVQYAEMYPIIFVSELNNCRMTTCLRGISIDNGTSTPIWANYANNCRDWGYYIRDLKYSDITGNACDFLNDTTKYPTRTRTCAAYKLRSLIGCNVVGNGDENTFGRSVELNDFSHSRLENHVSISIGSDYTGVDEIAWLYSTATMRGSVVRNNFAYAVKAGGLTYGGANAAKHHNIYFEALTNVLPEEFSNNIVALDRNTLTESGWGNNVPTTWINAARNSDYIVTHSPVLQAQVAGDLSVSYGADNAHYIERRGKLLHVFGCFDVTPTYTTASGLLIVNSFPTNGAKMAGIDVVGVAGGSGFAQKLGWFELAAASTGAVGRTDDDGNFTIAGIPTGTRVRIFYDGWYEVA